MESVERITSDGTVLAYIIRAQGDPPTTTFVTPEDLQLQVGFVVLSEGQEVPRHDHRPRERRIVGTTEALLVRRGLCQAEIYDEQRRLVSVHELKAGDVILLVKGGHGFRAVENTVLVELKQGPYVGPADRNRF